MIIFMQARHQLGLRSIYRVTVRVSFRFRVLVSFTVRVSRVLKRAILSCSAQL